MIMRHSLRSDRLPEHKGKFKTGNNDCSLSEEGVQFALEKASRLSTLLNEPISHIYTSPFLRTHQTSQLIAHYYKKNYNHHVDICELVHLAEGQTYEEPCFSDDLLQKLKEQVIKNPETLENIANRCRLVLNHVVKDLEYKNVLLVTHGVIYNELLKAIFPNIVFLFNERHRRRNWVFFALLSTPCLKLSNVAKML